MTVPPNYGPPPEQPQTPGYGYQSPYSGGQNPYGGQPQQPAYGAGGGQQPPYGGGGGQPPYGQEPGSPYGGPALPPEPPKRNLGLIGGIVVGATVLVLGAVLLVTMNIKGNENDAAEGGEDTSASASENENTPDTEATTPAEETDSEVGQCLPYESEVDGSGLGPLVDCGSADAFWEITAQTYDAADIAVDEEGNLADAAPVYEMCGDTWGTNVLGEAWTKWDYVYSSGKLDSLYCLQAVGNPDPAEPAHLPVMPDVGDCFDDSDSWWSVDCGSDVALYTVVDTIMLDEPVADMSDDEKAAQGGECVSDWYWAITDMEGRTHGFVCGDDL
ncbi:hypothetical protein [Glycomyces niveus]|uniref:Septum formation-related domain-containing protein n=1 Tax=Glycomyces niveus TaxID=2820287 RepID=A0ABS3U8W4_9ACTN|nr:hypothetical protein [Glycomyces sp. NEAU-S30]MBO3734193.1 hypothetical protein [Glycomyces sp. NEAU-S30]